MTAFVPLRRSLAPVPFLAALLVLAFVVPSPAQGADAVDLDELEARLTADPADAATATRLASGYRSSDQVQRGVAFFERFHADHPPNAMSLVWQGSLKTQLSADGEDMEQRLNWLQSGLAEMDRAVRTFPDQPEVRAVRGITISRFPEFLEMYDKAIRDLEHVLADEKALDAGFRNAAREALAQAYRQAGREAEALAVLGGER
jgi:hypothetical protein